MASTDRLDGRDWSLLGLLSILWGGSFFFNGVVLKELPPLTVVLLRVAIAALMLLPLLHAYRIPLPKGVPGWMPFFAIGLLNNVLPFSLIVIGQTYVSSGLASILNATTPLFTIVVMAVAGEEKLSARRVAGLVAGLAGVIVLHGGGLAFEAGQGTLPGRRLQLRTVRAAGAASPGKLAAAGNSDISAAGLGRNDDDRGRRG